MNSFAKQGHKIGLFFVLWTIICFVWFYIQPAERMLHMELLRLSFFYFSGMNWHSMLSALVQAYLWGYIAVATWVVATKISCLGVCSCKGKKCKK